MFSWLRSKWKRALEPETKLPRAGVNPANPGFTAKANWAFSDGQRTWSESMDVVQTLTSVLADHGRAITVEGPVLLDRDSQLSFRPLLESMEPIHGEGVRTRTTIEVTHPVRIPSPIFEFQHATGPNLEASIREGFEQWYDCDFPALCDAVREEAMDCQEMFVPIAADGSGERRRITLGPALHYQQEGVSTDCTDEDHCFCPCCLLTNSIEAFRPLLQAGGLHALRLFAMRNGDGQIDADCRVNGEDHDSGKQALIRYAKGWKPAGIEYRKQYVVIQNMDAVD